MQVGASQGRLTVSTGVAGSAARMGHRLVIVLDEWTASIDLVDGSPRTITLTALVASLRVESGSGGVKPLTSGDRQAIHANALGALHAQDHPAVEFRSTRVRIDGDALRVVGSLAIAGVTRPIEVRVLLERHGGRVRAECRVPVRQTDFGVRPYSAMLGQLKVADEVQVDLVVEVDLP
jgi:polyisoprenoid-binding protein YceI